MKCIQSSGMCIIISAARFRRKQSVYLLLPSGYLPAEMLNCISWHDLVCTFAIDVLSGVQLIHFEKGTKRMVTEGLFHLNLCDILLIGKSKCVSQ